MLGAVSEHPDGISPTELAGVLGVKPPHVTAMMTRLKRTGLANERADENDRRQKRIGLTPEGIRFVPRVERELRDGMRGLVKDARMKDLLAYVTVLSSIVDNGQED